MSYCHWIKIILVLMIFIALAHSLSFLICLRAWRGGWGKNYDFYFTDVETEAHISDLNKVTKLDWNLGLQSSVQPVGWPNQCVGLDP